MRTLLNGWLHPAKLNTAAVQRFRSGEDDNTGPTNSSNKPALSYLCSWKPAGGSLQIKQQNKKKISLAKTTAVFTDGRKEWNKQNVLPEIYKYMYFSTA